MSRRRDPVTPDVAEAVFSRDGNACVAPRLGATEECRDVWGNPIRLGSRSGLTLDHVHEGYGKAGKRAPSDPAHLVTVCHHHHLNGWATSHRPELRKYLEDKA